MRLLRPGARNFLRFISGVALVAATASAAEPPLPAGIRIPVVLTKSIGTKFAVGTPVEAETTSQVKLPASLGVIPKGTRVTGHISLSAPFDKGQSRISLLMERIEAKGAPLFMRAFIVGKVRARNSKLGTGPGAIYGIQIGGVPTHVPAIQQIPIDNSCKLVLSDDPEIGSEVISKERDVAMDIGTTFDVLTVEN